MAEAFLSPGIEELRGKLNGKSGMQMRVKAWKDDEGHVIKRGPQEFFRRNPRDYQRSPRTEAEKVQAGIWRDVCREASMIVKDKEHPRYAELRARWNAQLKGGGDPELHKEGKKNVIYGMFPVFVRMVLLKERKAENE